MTTISTPFGELKYVDTLVSKYYPSTMLYEDELGEPIMVEWMTVTSEREDIHYTFRVTKNNLRDFCCGDISHLELFKLASDDIFYETKKLDFDNCELKNYSQLDKSSMPCEDSYPMKEEYENYLTLKTKFGIELISAMNNAHDSGKNKPPKKKDI